MNYRDILVGVTEDRKNLELTKATLVASESPSDKVKGLKMVSEITAIISLQDKLINYVAITENKNVSEIRNEFDFTY